MSHGQTWDSRDVDYEVGSDSLDTTSLPARRQPECWPEFAGIHNVKQVQAPPSVTNAVSIPASRLSSVEQQLPILPPRGSR
jgi:hypothetical protein